MRRAQLRFVYVHTARCGFFSPMSTSLAGSVRTCRWRQKPAKRCRTGLKRSLDNNRQNLSLYKRKWPCQKKEQEKVGVREGGWLVTRLPSNPAARPQPGKVPRSLCALDLGCQPISSGLSRSIPSEAPASSRSPRSRPKERERERARLPLDCMRGANLSTRLWSRSLWRFTLAPCASAWTTS